MIIQRKFSPFPHRNLCCWCSLDLTQSEVILMNTHNILVGIYEEISKIISLLSSNTHLIYSSAVVGVFVFFGFSLTSLSRLFHSYRDEPIGRWGETGVPRENHQTHPQAELGLSHMWPVRGSNLHQSQRWDDRMIKSAEIQRPYLLGHGGRPSAVVFYLLKLN